jgi:23S rRNA pseudouridine2605 synthase
MPAERLQKLLARAGIGSRRACEDIITAGRVMVDGRVVTELGTKADPQTQDVRLDGSRLHPERPEYWLLNKPKGVVCTNLDPAGRSRPVDLMQHYTQTRLFPVGRLDADSKGLLLMTNDGLFANRLTHPRYEVSKTYMATVAGDVTPDDLRRLRRGVWLAEGRTRPAQVRVVRRGHTRSTLEVTIREGRNRQIRRTLARLGHNVWELVRTRIGRLTLRGVGAGHARPLTPDEVEYLKKLPETPPEAVERPYAGRDRPPSPPAGRRAALMAGEGRRVGPAPAAAAPSGGEAPPRRPFDPGERRPFRGGGRRREGAGRPPRGEHSPFGGGGRGREGAGRPPRGERRPFGGGGRGREGAGGPPRGERRPFRGEDRRREGAGRPPRGERRPFRGGDRGREGAGRPPRGERRPFRGEGRGREGAGGPPRGERRPFRGEGRGREGAGRPPRGEHSPFGGGGDRGRAGPDGYKRDSYREKRSRRQNDTDGVGKDRAGDRGHAGRGGGRERGRRDRPPFDGRRPHRHPPE